MQRNMNTHFQDASIDRLEDIIRKITDEKQSNALFANLTKIISRFFSIEILPQKEMTL